MALRLIFMGTPDFAVPALKALIQSRYEIVAVYTQPPRPAGRGMAVKKSPVHRIAEAHKIPVFTPENFKSKANIEAFQALKPDLAVVAAYGLLLPKEILEAPTFGCINIHASKLPKYRGAAPIQKAILEGKATTSITIMQMDEGLDTGDIIYRGTPIKIGNETGGGLHDLLALQGGDIIVKAIKDLTSGKIIPEPQNNAQATYAAKIKKGDAKIKWSEGAVLNERKVRAYNPFPGAYFEFRGKRFKILKGKVEGGRGKPGEVLDDALLIGTGDGAYRILEIQREGKKPMPGEVFLRGEKIPKGTVLD